MTTFAISAVGFCAHFSPRGDWALSFALGLARAQGLHLNVFDFLVDPYDPAQRPPEPAAAVERATLLVERERSLRFYYDGRLGDYVDVGFRLCEDRGWTELHRCLCKREFQLLVLAYPAPGATFAGTPIEQFATSFVCPAALVGPAAPTELRLNQPAALIADRLGLARDQFRSLGDQQAATVPGCASQPLTLR